MRDAIVQDRANIAPSPAAGNAARGAPYTFVAAIAKGGMGTVELCFRREGPAIRWAARKRLHDGLRSDPEFRGMFMDEARLAGLIRHPNVVRVFEIGEDGDGPYLMMDYVEGLSLARVARQAAGDRRPMPMQVALRICQAVAAGLHAAHEVCAPDGTPLNLVHRDVSPHNVLIGFDGAVRVTDFGVAKAVGNASRTSAGVLKGNMGYLAPEQLRFEEPDRRADVFSLGVTLFELLSGARLYANRAGFEGTRRILTEAPPDIRTVRGDVPPALAQLLREMLTKEINGRPATALEVAARLEPVLQVMATREGVLTVADYMDHHFAATREQHRALLTERLRERTGLALAARGAPPRASPRRWPLFGAIVAVGLMAGAAGVRVRRPEPAPPAPVAIRVAPHAVEVVPLPPPVAPEPPAAAPDPSPAPRPAGGRSHRNQRPRHRRVRR